MLKYYTACGRTDVCIKFGTNVFCLDEMAR